ncbi:MAG TPA: Swt1 family HEPN domain-containing protein [Acidimicrobiales bacterium]|nr:Swt1 family HEPN domain-containing protein [Acidimicrobiales bacterium]
MLGGYRAQVGMAFEVIAEALAPYVDRHMVGHLEGDDWILVASTKLGKRPDIAVSLTDPQFQLEVITRFWGPVFAKELDVSLREVVKELLTARNHWAHMSDVQPMDLPYAERVHELARDLLEGVRSPLVAEIEELHDRLRWESIHEAAAADHVDEQTALMKRMAELEADRKELAEQLEAAREAAVNQTGRTRAVARQLAELQTQYAAVAGLKEQYERIQVQLEAHAGTGDPERIVAQLESARQAAVDLRVQSYDLSDQLAEARRQLEDPIVSTAVGQRIMWLVAALLVTMSMVMVMVTTWL